jgi:2-polyprenyl-6-methoxyphenol hydroxylase-like FAD-dependent oxidoreductase
VVIVGGGVTGYSIAFHLAEQGVRDVVGLERRFLVADLITRGGSDVADVRDFRLDRCDAAPHDDGDDGGAFSHSYLR